MYLSSPPYALRVPPIPFFSILTPEQYRVRSRADHHTDFIKYVGIYWCLRADLYLIADQGSRVVLYIHSTASSWTFYVVYELFAAASYTFLHIPVL